MKPPVFDPRTKEELLRTVAVLAREYTPEWRYERAEDDPGAALAEIFCEMFYQSVDRMNAIPEKLFTEFLALAGFRMPAPTPASGLLCFTAHDTVTEPVPVPAGTQAYTPDRDGVNIVYETDRHIETTPAALVDVYYADPTEEVIQRLDFSRLQPFFAPVEGENLQRHTFSLSQNEVLTLVDPCTVEVELQQETRFLETETAALLAQCDDFVWSYRHGGVQIPFDAVRAEGGRILLEKRGGLPLEPDDAGHLAVTCTARTGSASVRLSGARLRSFPADQVQADRLAFGDVPITQPDGGYCFGRRPAAYGLFYIRSDSVLSKRGAAANLRLDLTAIVTDLTDNAPQYAFNQRIIDKQSAVAVQPDDVFISQVVWEYYNGLGWRCLEVTGDRNPFSCKREGRLEVVFQVPDDLCATEVNAEMGYHLRVRVVEVENALSPKPRWIVPFVREVTGSWQYGEGRGVDRCWSENNGRRVELQAAGVTNLCFPALSVMERWPRAMYLRFDRSPNAMPLSLLFRVAGQVRLEDKLLFEVWNGTHFEPVRSVDLTDNLQHTGLVLLYLPEPVPETDFFGQNGFWLRISRSSYLEGSAPKVEEIVRNVVNAVQQQRAEDQYFDVGVYEAGKAVQLLYQPVLDCEVWVDEVGALAAADAQALEKSLPGRVRIVREGAVMTHCWIRWEQVDDLALAEPGRRAFALEPYGGVLTFGDGRRGRVPPAGDHNLRVSFTWGGGRRGNVAPGQVAALVGSLPRIEHVVNLTAMSGGTDCFPQEKVESLGNKRLRHRGRAVGVRDFEELVAEAFPQAMHVRCFSGLDETGARAPGHVTLVVVGCDLDSERVTAGLCDQIYGFLSTRCSCCLVSEGRLHVCPSTVITVSTRIWVEMEDLDQAAATQQELCKRLVALIDGVWRGRKIGEQIRNTEIWQTVRETPNVRLVSKILVEGAYDRDGEPHLAALEEDTDFPFATVHSGTHLIRLSER